MQNREDVVTITTGTENSFGAGAELWRDCLSTVFGTGTNWSLVHNYLSALYQRSAEPTGARQGDMAMQSAKRTTVHSRQSFIGSDGRRARRSLGVREELTGRDRSRDNALSARLENPLLESQSMRLFGFTQ